jgi:hypothetical protein
MKAYRQRMSEAGYRRVCFNATPETAARLDAVRGRERTIDAVINAALDSYQGEGGEGVVGLVGPSDVTALHEQMEAMGAELAQWREWLVTEQGKTELLTRQGAEDSRRIAELKGQVAMMRGWFGELTGYPESIQREAVGMLENGAKHEAVLIWLESTIGKAPRANASKVFTEWRKRTGQP